MKKLLIVVDYQNDFVCGSLGFKNAEKLEEPIAEKIKQYREQKEDILFTLDTHGENYLQTIEGTKLPVPHCLHHTPGWNLYGKIANLKAEQDKCFLKSSFGSPELFDFLRTSLYTHIELAGVVSNICVLSNAVLAKTALPETEIIVDARCVAGNDTHLHEAALDVMESLQINIINR